MGQRSRRVVVVVLWCADWNRSRRLRGGRLDVLADTALMQRKASRETMSIICGQRVLLLALVSSACFSLGLAQNMTMGVTTSIETDTTSAGNSYFSSTTPAPNGTTTIEMIESSANFSTAPPNTTLAPPNTTMIVTTTSPQISASSQISATPAQAVNCTADFTGLGCDICTGANYRGACNKTCTSTDTCNGHG
eukprot:3752747-Rhodomonas_salina.1